VAGALIFLAMASLMLVVGNGIALVMKSAPTSHAGSASSLLGVLQYAFAGVIGAALALAYDATLTPFITAMLLCAVGAPPQRVIVRATGSSPPTGPPVRDERRYLREQPSMRFRRRRVQSGHGRDIRLEILALLDAEREEHAHHLEVLALRRLLVQHATAGRVSYRLTPWVPNNQNAEVSHNTIRMANSTPPAMGSAQPG